MDFEEASRCDWHVLRVRWIDRPGEPRCGIPDQGSV